MLAHSAQVKEKRIWPELEGRVANLRLDLVELGYLASAFRRVHRRGEGTSRSIMEKLEYLIDRAYEA